MQQPFNRLLLLTAGGAMALGLGFGLGLTSSGKPFMLEATGTPIGSFMFKGNLSYSELLLPAPAQENQQLPGYDQIA